jgi:predicted porin
MPIVRGGGPRGGLRLHGLLALLTALAAPHCRAERWLLERSVDAGLEVRNNAALTPGGGPTDASLTLAGTLSLERAAEDAATRLDAALRSGAGDAGTGAGGRIEGTLGLRQTLTLPLDAFELAWRQQRDTPGLAARSSVDLLAGAGERRASNLSANWSHRLDERSSASLGASLASTRFGGGVTGNSASSGAGAATAFESPALNAGLQWSATERLGLTLSARRSRFESAGAGNRSRTDSLSVGAGYTLSPTGSLNASIGRDWTWRSTVEAVLVCLQPIAVCQSGGSAFVRVLQPGQSRQRGLQYSVGWREALDPRSDVGVDAASQVVPSGAGVVVRSHTLAARLHHALTPELAADGALSSSFSVVEGAAGAPQPRLKTLTLGLAYALAERLSLRAGFEQSQSRELRLGTSARTQRLSISVRHEWPGLEGRGP